MKTKRSIWFGLMVLFSMGFLPRCTLASSEELELIKRPEVGIDTVKVPDWELRE